MTRTLTVVLLLLSCELLYSENNYLDSIEVGAGFGIGSLLSGEQKDFFNDSLEPTPGDFFYNGLYVSAKYFPVDHFGVNAGGTFAANMMTNNPKTKSLIVLNMNDIKVGVSARIPDIYAMRSIFSLGVNVGIDYTFVSYSADFKALVPSSLRLYNIDPALGFYASVDFQMYFLRNAYWGASVEISTLNGFIPESKTPFDGLYFKVPFYIGFCG